MEGTVAHSMQRLSLSEIYKHDSHHVKAALDTFDYLDNPVLILSESSQFYYSNKALAENDRVTGLFRVLLNDQVIFKLSEHQALFETAVREVLSFSLKHTLPRSSAFLIEHDGLFYRVKVKKWFESPSKRIKQGESSFFLLLVIKELNQNRLISSQEISRVFGLSVAEAIVCRYLCQGYELSQIADIRHVSKHTVRHQLKSIYQKTQTSSQSQLVAFILSVAID